MFRLCFYVDLNGRLSVYRLHLKLLIYDNRSYLNTICHHLISLHNDFEWLLQVGALY